MQAANFDNWNPFILISGILALFTAGVFILGSWKVINMMSMLILVMVMAMVTLISVMAMEMVTLILVMATAMLMCAGTLTMLLLEKVTVKVMTILIPVQEATLASGGKNKAVRKKH